MQLTTDSSFATEELRPLPNFEPDLFAEKFRLLSGKELAKVLDLSPRTIEAWRLSRRIPYIQINSRLHRYRLSEVLAWLEKGHVAATKEDGGAR